MNTDGLDHVVLTVRDLDVTCDFYSSVMGMEVRVNAEGRRSLHFGVQKINLHLAGHEFEPKALRPVPGSGDLCFVTAQPIEEVAAELAAAGVEVLLGPVEREGARGRMSSIYIRDPDGNLVEVSRYV